MNSVLLVSYSHSIFCSKFNKNSHMVLLVKSTIIYDLFRLISRILLKCLKQDGFFSNNLYMLKINIFLNIEFDQIKFIYLFSKLKLKFVPCIRNSIELLLHRVLKILYTTFFHLVIDPLIWSFLENQNYKQKFTILSNLSICHKKRARDP